MQKLIFNPNFNKTNKLNTILNVNYFKSNFISQQIFSVVCRTTLHKYYK